jgi:hypothetical protein
MNFPQVLSRNKFLHELRRIESGTNVDSELADLIKLIAVIMDGFKNEI